MKIPRRSSPAWPLIYFVVGGTVGTFLMTYLYKNGFAEKDVITLVSTLASGLGVAGVRKVFAPDDSTESGDKP